MGGVDGLEVRFVDMLESSVLCDLSDFFYILFLWRFEFENVLCGGLGFELIVWEYVVEEIRFVEDFIVEFADELD